MGVGTGVTTTTPDIAERNSMVAVVLTGNPVPRTVMVEPRAPLVGERVMAAVGRVNVV
jgi:hypothetical protein